MMFVEINPAYPVAALFFMTCGCYLYLCVLLCTSSVNTKLFRDYLIVGVLLAFFSLFYGLMTIAEDETLLRISWAGGFIAGCLFYPRWIQFLLNMVAMKFRGISTMTKVTHALAILSSVLCVFSNDAMFVKTKYGNQFSYQNSPFFIAAFILISFLIVFFWVLHVRWWREAEMQRHRKQAFWFIIITGLVNRKRHAGRRRTMLPSWDGQFLQQTD